MIIFDADILSMFAKADSLDIMTKTLAKFRICITPRIKKDMPDQLQEIAVQKGIPNDRLADTRGRLSDGATQRT